MQHIVISLKSNGKYRTLDKTDILLGMASQTEEDKKLWHIHTTYIQLEWSAIV